MGKILHSTPSCATAPPSVAPGAATRRPVSRVLCPGLEPGRWPFLWDARRRAPRATHPGDRPGTGRAPAGADAVAPTRSCSRWGLPCRPRCRRRGALLPHRFTLTRRRFPVPAGGLFSVALSLGSPPPGVTRHRVPVEPGLSSPEGGAPGSGHPATSRRTAQMRIGEPFDKAATASKRPIVSASSRPSTRHGRNRRWNAASTARRCPWSATAR
jgi:hypothetical protein